MYWIGLGRSSKTPLNFIQIENHGLEAVSRVYPYSQSTGGLSLVSPSPNVFRE